MTRPLFWRTLVAIAAVAWLSVVGAMFLWTYLAPQTGTTLREVIQASRELELAYRRFGVDEARQAQDDFQSQFGTRPYLVDALGRDLLDGETRANLVTPQRDGSTVALADAGADGRQAGVRVGFEAGTIEGRFHGRWPRQVAYGALLALPLIVMFSWPLARRLTAPVAQLERVVERFGTGDFGARATPTGDDEVGRLSSAFNEMADQVQTVLTKHRQLLFDVSHELRTPLARLLLYVELLESEGASVDRMNREIDRLDQLLEQILALARVETPEAIAARIPTRLDELVEDVVDACEVEANAAGCRLALNTSAPAVVQSTPDLLRSAIENIIRNAIDHAPPDTVVDIDLAITADTARVQVRDHGPGASEPDLQRLFEPFFRGEPSRPGSHGLGLAISQGAVASHQGTIAAANAQPGLRVTVSLPVSAATPRDERIAD
ncbi:MAG: HAMP domain-containing protein [Acidobacteria bacterium]|nr:HAMP domain-containing protein [Acidobacteriota bacterium]